MAENETRETESHEAEAKGEGFCSGIYSESLPLPPVTIAQCVAELVQNSVDADAKEIEVSIDLRSLGIRIKDDGHGLSKEDLKSSGSRYYCSRLHTFSPNSRHNANCMELYDRQLFISCLIKSSSSVQIISNSSSNSTGLSYLKTIINGKFTGEIIETKESVFNKSGLIMDFHNLFSQNGAQKKDISNTSEMEHIKHYLDLICLMNQHLSVKVMDAETGNIIFKDTSQMHSFPYLYENDKQKQRQGQDSASSHNLNVSRQSSLSIGTLSETKVTPTSKIDTSVAEEEESHQEVKSSEHNFLESGKYPELLEMILHKLDTRSLLDSCRGVNSLWTNISTNLLLKREALIARFRFDGVKNTFILSDKRGKSKIEWDLSTLTDLLLQAKTYAKCFAFPCNAFRFYSGHLQHPDLQFFMFKHGKIIKNLRILPCTLERDASDNVLENIIYFRILLLFYLPNLETLKLTGLPFLGFDTIELFPGSLSLTQNNGKCRPLFKLKALHFMSYIPKNVFDDLLRVGQNIQDISFEPFCSWRMFNMCSWLLEADKIHLLRSLEVKLNDDSIDVYDNISDHTLFLKTLIISASSSENMADDVYWPRIAQVMHKLLKSTTNSLVILNLDLQSMGISARLQIPVMQNLRKFRMVGYKEDARGFPLSFDLLDTFPLLEFYESEDFYCCSEQWDTVFEIKPSSRPLLSLNNIYFQYGPPNDWFGKFPRMFPNLKIVKFGLIKNFPNVSKALWNLSKLETLEFQVDVNEENHCFPAMDAAFTGFSKETCRNLFEKSVDVDVDPSIFDGLRETNSILDVKSLRRLRMTLYDFSEEKKALPLRFISHVAGILAFQMCPQLRVSIWTFANKRDNERVLRKDLKLRLPSVDVKTLNISSI